MKTTISIACIAIVSFGVGIRTVVTRVEAVEVREAERIVTLEDRVTTLERKMKACCSTDTMGLGGARSDLEVMVRLRKQLDELEARVKELEKE